MKHNDGLDAAAVLLLLLVAQPDDPADSSGSLSICPPGGNVGA